MKLSTTIKKPHLLLIAFFAFACTIKERDAAYYTIDSDQMAKAVTISRDNYGIPHIYGPTDESVIFGLAYARAEDHFELIENAVIGSIGRQAEVSGPSGVPGDYQVRAFKTIELSKKEYDELDNKDKLLCDAYAAGLNYYLRTHPRKLPQLITHFEPWHFLAVERFMWSFMGFSQSGLTDDEVSKYLRDKSMEPRVGSNMWAISPKKTKNGKTYLVINPHIPADQPYEVHLKSGEGWNFYGLMAYGCNIIPVLGHNESMGWSLTVNYPDIGDAFRMAFDNPDDSLQYKFDDEYLTAQTWIDSIKVKTDSGMVTRRYTFMETIHGPVLTREGSYHISYRVANFERGGSVSQFYRMSKAENVEEFKDAIASTSIAFHNILYADKEGNIFYVYNGTIPKRNGQLDWTKSVDGSDPKFKWNGYHDIDDLPQLLNPSTGYLQNCNSNPFGTTSRENPDAADFPDYMTIHQPQTERAERSLVILDSMQEVNMSTLEQAIMDTYVFRADKTLPELFAEFDNYYKTDYAQASKYKKPLDALRNWDKFSRADSEEATLYFIYDELLYGTPPSETWPKVTYFRKAVDLIQADKGTWEVPWGEVMRHQRAADNEQYGVTESAPSFPLAGGSGATGVMFCIWQKPIQDKIMRRSNGGHSYVAIVEFGDTVKAKSIIPYGNSRDPNSPHYTDQAARYAAGKFKSVLFTDDEVKQNLESRYHPGDDVKRVKP